MSINLYFDLETIPSQDKKVKQYFIDEAKNNFKAPSNLSKKQALLDMGLNGEDQPQKYWTKDDTISHWVDKFSKEKAPEVADENWRKTSFDGGLGEIISCSFSDGMKMMNVHRKLNSKYTEDHMIEELFTSIHKLCKRTAHTTKPFFIGHNISGFDLAFLFQRAVILGIDPGFDIPVTGRHGAQYYDTMIGWSGHKGKISQNQLARVLDIPEKPGDIDGSKVWDFVERGDVKRVAEYNDYDVETVIKIHDRLTFNDRVTLPPIMAQEDKV